LEWQRLGIAHERIQPGKPQRNSRNERMHRTLKQDTMNPQPKQFALSRGGLIDSVASTATNGLTKHSSRRHREACMLQAHGYCHTAQRHVSIPHTSRLDA
jgi:hypothetical protein